MTRSQLAMLLVELDAAHPFAKEGLMYRDGLSPGAATVIIDVKPDGGIEFMARRCAGCDMEFIDGGSVGGTFVELFLVSNADGTFDARATGGTPGTALHFTVTVPMANPISGYAVTSHDPAHVASARFTHPIM